VIGPYGPAPLEQQGGSNCAQPEVSDSVIVSALNGKIGEFGGPPRRVSGIQKAPPLDQDMSAGHIQCQSTLLFSDGGTETGLLLQDSVNGVLSWRWHSAQDLTPAAQKRRQAEILNQMQREAESTPDKIIHCGVDGPESIFMTNAVCTALIRFVADNRDKLRPYAGYAILQGCSRLSASVCLGIIEELQSLASVPQPRAGLMERCADDLENRFPGNGKAQYMNSCQGLMDYFR
jgi:hypothetical protein